MYISPFWAGAFVGFLVGAMTGIFAIIYVTLAFNRSEYERKSEQQEHTEQNDSEPLE